MWCTMLSTGRVNLAQCTIQAPPCLSYAPLPVTLTIPCRTSTSCHELHTFLDVHYAIKGFTIASDVDRCVSPTNPV